jgi:tetratricopeptide (TPR) repeat protein
MVRAAALTGAALVLTNIGPFFEPAPSPETLAMLDPSRGAAASCGQFKGANLLRQRIRLAGLFASPAGAMQASVPLQPGLGSLAFPVTANAQARPYFIQGLMLSYGFNHAGAIASFREAQRLDPGCALCWWGEAFAHGPNINAPMAEGALAATLAAVAKARSLGDRASPAERALIEAIAVRYSDDPKAERAALDKAYADAMLDAAKRFPDHDDIAILAAEAVMDTVPWNYWGSDQRTPNGRIGEAVHLVETVLARNPDHPQAAHLYIHLMENSFDPRRAEAAADRLAKPLTPAAGHLVHMPAHIYLRLGRFADSIRSNVAAARADEAYLQSSGDKGLYRYGYYPHNVHFIVTSAQMAGDMGTAVREAKRLASILDVDIATRFGWIQAIHAAPYFAYAQVASPKEILALPEADRRMAYVVGVRHYARAVAQAQRRDRKAFDQELAALRSVRTGTDVQSMVAQGVPAPDLLELAEHVALGRFAVASKRYGEAAGHFRQAAEIEDRIPYMEPPFWYYPVRQSLGAALYRAGKLEEARQAFREALLRSPNNGWALYGLAQTERKLGHRLEAAAANQALSRAWLGSKGWLRMERL